MNLLRCFAILLLLAALPAVTWAARLDRPYHVEVPVASQSAQDRAAGSLAGLQQLLQRLTGQPVVGNARVEAAAARMETYLLQFGYQPAETPGTFLLVLEFSPPAVQQLVREAGLVFWPLERPAVLCLVTAGQGELLLPELDISRLARLGRERGVPLRFAPPGQPDLDWSAVQRLDAASLSPLATREGADALLLGQLAGSNEQGWTSQWLLQANGQDYLFSPAAPSATGVVDLALQEAARYLSGGYRSSVSTDTGPATLRVQVDNVRHYAAFAQLRDYLENLDGVTRATLVGIQGTAVVYDVEVRGRESFRSLMELFRAVRWVEERLPLAPPAGAEAVSPPANPVPPVWVYQWVL